MSDDHLRTNLRRLLAETGRSARSVSEEAGLSESFVKHILNERSHSPRYENVEALARVFGLTAAQLTASDPIPAPTIVQLPQKLVKDQTELRILRYWGKLTPEARRIFLRQITDSSLTD